MQGEERSQQRDGDHNVERTEEKKNMMTEERENNDWREKGIRV